MAKKKVRTRRGKGKGWKAIESLLRQQGYKRTKLGWLSPDGKHWIPRS